MSELPAKKTTTHVEIEVRSKLLYVKFMGPQVGQRESPIISLEVEPYLKAAGKDLKHFIIDIKGVNFMSSMGVGVCIALRNKAVAAGGKPILFGTSPELVKLLAMMKIDQMYKLAKDQSELDMLLRG
jgi:anti-sigma B factor antagonist